MGKYNYVKLIVLHTLFRSFWYVLESTSRRFACSKTTPTWYRAGRFQSTLFRCLRVVEEGHSAYGNNAKTTDGKSKGKKAW